MEIRKFVELPHIRLRRQEWKGEREPVWQRQPRCSNLAAGR